MYNNFYNLQSDTIARAKRAELNLEQIFASRAKIKANNFCKVLKAMQKNQLSDRHFDWKTGYGYDDAGREIVEAIYRDIFQTEDALVRTQIVNGTHALSLGLRAILQSGDSMLAISGKPYDTILSTIDYLKARGVGYQEVALNAKQEFDYTQILKQLSPKTKLIYIQRSSGYSFRRALTIDEIAAVINIIREQVPDVLVMVDNCYGEFVESKEPAEVGANLVAGSLIKNIGGGLALSGGYLAGDSSIIQQAAELLTAPGIGKECGLTFGQTRSILHGLFIAPNTVDSALRSAIFAAELFANAGFAVAPLADAKRADIIQSIMLGDEEKVIAFCQAIQSASPVDSFVKPLPWDMPGYDDKVVMAAGGFVAGSSIELSADAPIREPYAVYLQGALDYDHGKLAAMIALEKVQSVF